MDATLAARRITDPSWIVTLANLHREIIIPIANGEPKVLLDLLDEHGHDLRSVRTHQMHVLRDRPFLHDAYEGFRHVSYFLSAVTRQAFAEGGCDFVPAHFSEVPHILRNLGPDALIIAAASLPDKHGWFSLGTNADYVSRLVGQRPIVLEANPNMPRTRGENSVHVSQIVGWIQVDYPLVEANPIDISYKDVRIGEYVAERIPDGATIQAGIGSVPSAVLKQLVNHRDLGVHTELFSDGLADLFMRGVVTGTKKARRPGKMVATFALGTQGLYDFLNDNAAVEMIGVDWVNNPRIIGSENTFISVNGTCEVDLAGQANSEMINGRMWSGSGGQADFAHGVMFSPNGQGFLTLHSTNSDETVSRIKVKLGEGAMVTTLKNAVDKVVTEYGVAELFGQPLSVRARRLIDIAHPKFRDELEVGAKVAGFLH